MSGTRCPTYTFTITQSPRRLQLTLRIQNHRDPIGLATTPQDTPQFGRRPPFAQSRTRSHPSADPHGPPARPSAARHMRLLRLRLHDPGALRFAAPSRYPHRCHMAPRKPPLKCGDVNVLSSDTF